MAAKFLQLFRNFELLERVAATHGFIARFVVSILQSRYFLIAASFYLLVMLMLGPIVVSHYQIARSTFEQGDQLLVLPPPGPPPPPMPQQAISEKSSAVKKTTEVAVKSTMSESAMQSARQSAASRLTVSAPSTYIQPSTPVVAPTIGAIDVKVGTDMGAKIADAEVKRLIGVRDFQKGWLQGTAGGTGGGGGGSGPASGSYRHGGGKSVRAKFTVFQAKYQDGDWNCNPEALVNLMLQIRRWSRDRIDANIFPEILDVGTDQLFTLKPPFIYLTGHKDFHFKEQEVKNIRDYLMMGGAVWADSALAGRRSRFDIAFRREMKRVLPDRDFEDVKPDHEMFDVFFENVPMPSGMNSYEEPIEMINIGSELAVLYTLNGYGHFWESRLNKDGKLDDSLVNVGTNAQGKTIWRHVFGPHRSYPRPVSGTMYRNINDDSVRNAYKFGINVVVHLLTRYQKYFKFLPKELPKSEVRGKTEPSAAEEAPAAVTVSNAPPLMTPRGPRPASADKGTSGTETNKPSTTKKKSSRTKSE